MEDQRTIEADGVEADGENVISPSILDQIKQSRQRITEDHYLDLEIAGFEGNLVARYHPVPFKQFEAAEKRSKKDKSAPLLLLAALEQIIITCDQILVRDPGHVDCVLNVDGSPTELRPIDPEAARKGFPVKWDVRLADLIGIPETEHGNDPKRVVLRTFCNDAAVIHHSTQIGIWLRDTTRDVDDQFLGE